MTPEVPSMPRLDATRQQAPEWGKFAPKLCETRSFQPATAQPRCFIRSQLDLYHRPTLGLVHDLN